MPAPAFNPLDVLLQNSGFHDLLVNLGISVLSIGGASFSIFVLIWAIHRAKEAAAFGRATGSRINDFYASDANRAEAERLHDQVESMNTRAMRKAEARGQKYTTLYTARLYVDEYGITREGVFKTRAPTDIRQFGYKPRKRLSNQIF